MDSPTDYRQCALPEAPKGFRFRSARPTDADLLKDFYVEMLRDIEHMDYDHLPTNEAADWVIDEVVMPDGGQAVVILDGLSEDGGWEPVGAAIWALWQPSFPVRRKTVMSWGLYVCQGSRGGGVGTALQNAAVERAMDIGADRIMLQITKDNHPALRAAERSGFEPMGEFYTLNI